MDEDQRPLHVTHIACGRRHCMAALDYGAFFYWGDNVSGQLGNRKRSFLESPFPKRKFELHHNVIGLAAGLDSSAVIVQSLPDRVKKNKYPKRVMSLQELQEKSAKAIEDENMAKLDIHKKHDKKLKEESGTPQTGQIKTKVWAHGIGPRKAGAGGCLEAAHGKSTV